MSLLIIIFPLLVPFHRLRPSSTLQIGPLSLSPEWKLFWTRVFAFFSSVIILINLFMTTFESAQWRKASHRSATFTRVENFPNQLVCSFSLLPQIKFTFTLFHWVCSCSWSWWVCWFPPETDLKIKEDKSLLKMHFKPQGSCAVDELQKLTQIILSHSFYRLSILWLGYVAFWSWLTIQIVPFWSRMNRSKCVCVCVWMGDWVGVP